MNLSRHGTIFPRADHPPRPFLPQGRTHRPGEGDAGGRSRGSPATRRPPLPQGMPPARRGGCWKGWYRRPGTRTRGEPDLPRLRPAGRDKEAAGRDKEAAGGRRRDPAAETPPPPPVSPRPGAPRRLREAEGATWRDGAAAWRVSAGRRGRPHVRYGGRTCAGRPRGPHLARRAVPGAGGITRRSGAERPAPPPARPRTSVSVSVPRPDRWRFQNVTPHSLAPFHRLLHEKVLPPFAFLRPVSDRPASVAGGAVHVPASHVYERQLFPCDQVLV